MRGSCAAAIAVLFIVLAGCGSGDDAKPGASPAVSVSALFSSTHKAGLEPAIAEFQKANSSITVKPVSFAATADVRTLLLTRLQSNSAPDVFFTNSGNAAPSAVWPLGRQGKLLDLSQSAWAKTLSEYSKPGASVNGKTYAVPIALFLQGVAYNEDVFQKLGLAVPTTFGELVDTCRKAAKGGVTPFAQGFAELNGFSNYLAILASLTYVKQPDWDEQRARGAVSFAGTETWKRGLSMLSDMKDAGCFSKRVSGTGIEDAYGQLVHGDAAMSVLASVQAGALKAIDPAFVPGWFPFPADNAEDTRLIVNSSAGISASAATKHPKQVRAFIDFLGEPAEASKIAKLTGGVSDGDVKGCNLDAALEGFLALCKSGQLQAAKAGGWPNQNMALGYLNQSLQGLIVGKTTVDEILKGLDYMWDHPDATAPPAS
jgi:raffinose/stachyose/melibiose transport system substrate-binding protein